MKFYSLLIFLFVSIANFAQDTSNVFYAKFVTAESLKKNLTVLASDEYEGRETGQKGQKMAAEYIMQQFKDFGIPANPKLANGYFQTFPLAVFQPQQIQMAVNKKSFEQNKDYFSAYTVLEDATYELNDVVFAGYGINTLNYNDYKDLDVKNKTVMIMSGEPFDTKGKSYISQSDSPSDWSRNYRMKLTEARKAEIAVLLVVEKNFKESFKELEHRITSYKMSLANEKKETGKQGMIVISISEEVANLILKKKKNSCAKLQEKISKSGKPLNKKFKTKIVLNVKQETNTVNTENVLAFVEGTDLKDEIVVITAHYDHLGKHDGVVYNGADDDGSGTVAVIELAKVFAKAKKDGKGPRRSMLFMTVAGEEKGLLGSDYYTQDPVYPLAQTVCDLNIDMIGRLDKAHAGDPNYIYLIGSDKLSKDLHDISEAANKKYSNLKLDYTYNDEKDPNRYYYRSDHYNFAKNNIPVIFYFNGVHEDYHKETDEVSKIDFAKMEKITRLVFYTAWDLANRTERIKLDKK